MDTVQDVMECGSKAKGRSARIRCLEGKPVTRKQAILAYCYDCTGGYEDGAQDCGDTACSLYPYHPYRKKRGEAL